ncbi:MAG: ABC transporter permease subunit [Propionibacteriales bacterium]|nr:ABC transporter permease subunit [Propionibacteriales bacterium]
MNRVSTRARWGLGSLPLLLFYVAFFLLPQLYFLRLSLYRTDTVGQQLGAPGFQTIAKVLSSDFYRDAIVSTIALCVLTMLFTLVLAYPIAYSCVRSRTWGRFIFICVVASMFSSAVARVLGWRVLLAIDGPVNRLLQLIGLVNQPVQLTGNFYGVLIGTVHAMLPIAAIGLMPVCEAVSREQLEAATGLGSSSWRTFRTVFLPQTWTGLVSIGLLVFAVTAGAFTTPALLGGGRVAILAILIYTAASQSLDYSVAAALSLVLFALVGGAVLLGLVVGRSRSGPKVGST